MATTWVLFLENRGHTHRCKGLATFQATCSQPRCDQSARRAHPLCSETQRPVVSACASCKAARSQHNKQTERNTSRAHRGSFLSAISTSSAFPKCCCAFGFAAFHCIHRHSTTEGVLPKTRFRGHYGSNLISRAHACCTWRAWFLVQVGCSRRVAIQKLGFRR